MDADSTPATIIGAPRMTLGLMYVDSCPNPLLS